jgi:hypothetical protein
MMLPGTHDSGAYSLNVGNPLDNSADWAHGPDWTGFEKVCDEIKEGWLGDWLREQCIGVLKDAVPYTQNLVARNITTAQGMDIWKQLENGIRYFDLRVTYRDPSVFPLWSGFRLYHGLIGGELETVLADIRGYLESVDGELLVLNFSHLNVGTNQNLDWRCFTTDEHDALMDRIVGALGDFAILRDATTPYELRSTLMGDLTANGPAIVMIYSVDSSNCPVPNNSLGHYFWKGGDLVAPESGYTNTTDLRYQETGVNDKGERKGQRLHFEDHVDSGSTELFALYQTLTANADIATLNAKNLLRPFQLTLRVLSQDVNQHLGTFMKESDPRFPQIALVDFPEESDVVAQAIRIGSLCNSGSISGRVSATPSTSWPPNHKMIPVTLDVSGLTLPNPDQTVFTIEEVWVEEPDRKTGENIYTQNEHEPDWNIIDDLALEVRKERSGQADERIYSMALRASDCGGDYRFNTELRITHDQGK